MRLGAGADAQVVERGCEALQVRQAQLGEAYRLFGKKAGEFFHIHPVADTGVFRQSALEAYMSLVGVEKPRHVGYAAQFGHVSVR